MKALHSPGPAGRAGPASRTLDQLLYGLLLTLAAILPFEAVQPIASIGGLSFTNLELLLGLAFALAAIGLTLQDARTSYRESLIRQSPILVPGTLFVVVAVLSAAVSPDHKTEAFKFAMRFATGLACGALTMSVISSRARAASMIGAVIAGSATSALLGIGELATIPPVVDFLSQFKESPSFVGGSLRMSATFQYATIASMYYEMTLPLAIVGALAAPARASRVAALAAALILICLIPLTLTRAGMATVLLIVSILPFLTWYPTRRSKRPFALAVTLILPFLLITGTLAATSSSFRTRMMTENDTTWYRASYDAPDLLTVKEGHPILFTLVAQNTGSATWMSTGPNAYALGHRWLTADGTQVLQSSHQETPLPRNVAPGESITLQVAIESNLPSGSYRLTSGMLQQNILWFHHRDVPDAATMVFIESNPHTPDSPSPNLPQPTELAESSALPTTVPRRDLWRAALQMFFERPWLGVGPDGFRTRYGKYLGLANWDFRIHSNNLYLELLATTGVAGILSFIWLLVALLRRGIALRRGGTPVDTMYWGMGLLTAVAAFLAHGFLDYFLGFTAISLLFWMICGMIGALYVLPTAVHLIPGHTGTARYEPGWPEERA